MKKLVFMMLTFCLLFSVTIHGTEKEKAEEQADDKFNAIQEYSDNQLDSINGTLRNNPDYFSDDDELNAIDEANLTIWQVFFKVQAILREFLILAILVSFGAGLALNRIFHKRAKGLETTGFLMMTVMPLIMLGIVYFDGIKAWIAV